MDTSANRVHAARRLGLGDGLILVVAVAISLERFRALWAIPQHAVWCWQAIAQLAGWSHWRWVLTREQVIVSLRGQVIVLLLELFCPLFLGLMVAQPLLRLRRPRPPLVEVARQSGFVTCLMGILAVVLLLPMGSEWFQPAGSLARIDASHHPLDDLAALRTAAVACGSNLDRPSRPRCGLGLDRRALGRDGAGIFGMGLIASRRLTPESTV